MILLAQFLFLGSIAAICPPRYDIGISSVIPAQDLKQYWFTYTPNCSRWDPAPLSTSGSNGNICNDKRVGCTPAPPHISAYQDSFNNTFDCLPNVMQESCGTDSIQFCCLQRLLVRSTSDHTRKFAL